MKFFLATAFLLLLISHSTIAQEWETLGDDAYDQISYLEHLRDVGVSYVQQIGKYQSTRGPLPGHHYRVSSNYPQSLERRNASDVTYYRWNVSLVEDLRPEGNGDSLVTATFTVSYRTSNSNFIVTSYRYTVDSDGNAPDPEEEVGSPQFDGSTTTYIDFRPFNNNTGDLSELLGRATDDIVAQAIENGDLPDAEYTRRFVYEAYIYEIPELKTLNCAVKLVNSDGNNFLVHIEADYDYTNDNIEQEATTPFRYNVLIP